MRLLVATPLYPPESGGPATYSKLLEEHLPDKGDDISLVKFSEVKHMPKGIRHFEYFQRAYAAGKNADVILALDPVSTGLPALFAAKLLDKPFVVKIVGDFAWEQGSQRYGITGTLDEFVKQEKTPFAVACLRAVQTFVARHATKIIVPSNYLKGIISAWGIPPAKIEVIYNSISLPVLQKSFEVREASIVSSGRLVPWKGMEKVIDAVAEVQKEILSVTLTIVGDGPDRKKLEEQGEKQLGNSISFTGMLSQADNLNTIQSSSIYVLNSSYEGLSHQLIEAMMLGKAIIATSVGGNPELIEDGVNGLLVAYGDEKALEEALKKLLQDAEMPFSYHFFQHLYERTFYLKRSCNF
jgi:glycosyltransferase involved in cell wall biosynthesis